MRQPCARHFVVLGIRVYHLARRRARANNRRTSNSLEWRECNSSLMTRKSRGPCPANGDGNAAFPRPHLPSRPKPQRDNQENCVNPFPDSRRRSEKVFVAHACACGDFRSCRLRNAHRCAHSSAAYCGARATDRCTRATHGRARAANSRARATNHRRRRATNGNRSAAELQ